MTLPALTITLPQYDQYYHQNLAVSYVVHTPPFRRVWFLRNNNNNHDDIYSAVIMTEVIARVHSVHLVNTEQRQAAADSQTKPPDLGCESAVLGLGLQPPSPFIIITQPES